MLRRRTRGSQETAKEPDESAKNVQKLSKNQTSKKRKSTQITSSGKDEEDPQEGSPGLSQKKPSKVNIIRQKLYNSVKSNHGFTHLSFTRSKLDNSYVLLRAFMMFFTYN